MYIVVELVCLRKAVFQFELKKETQKEAATARERQEPVLYHLTGDLYSAIR